MRLLDFWGDRTIADVTSATCRAYAAQRPSTAGARRDLEDLRGALNHYMAEVFARPGPPVRLPPKPAPRDRWLESGEAARLIWTAWRYREVQKGMTTQRRTRQHIARFAIVALYTGSRAGAICSASFERMPGRGYVDLESGLFYRRPEGEAETNKRKPTITLPRRLLAHMRRWRANGQTYVVEFGGKPVARIGKAFRHVVADSGLGPDVTPHVLRHTAITWAMREGMRPWKAAGYFGLSVDMIDRVYGHHSPDGNAETGEAITRRGAEKVRKLSAITA
ncbi:MAG: site-specific integrase [Pseudomonadota bacterium]